MSADRFESRVAAWLEDGPDEAPRGLEASALEHARLHPRSRRATLLRLGGSHGRALATAAVIVVAVGALVVLPGIGESDRGGGPVAVRGGETCATRVPGMQVSTTETGQARIQGRITTCDDVSADRRVQGELTRWITADLFDADADYPAGTSNQYGTTELRTDDGAWTGAFVGTFLGRTAPTLEGRLSWIGLGSGAHDGLVYRATVVTDATLASTVTGTIEPIGEAAIASTWCVLDSPTAPGVFEPVNGIRDFSRTCTITSEDARLAGTATEHRTITTGADGTPLNEGSIVITTADGGWTGTFAGTGDWFVPGDVRGTLDGVGALAGTSLRVRILSEDGMRGVLVGEFVPAP